MARASLSRRMLLGLLAGTLLGLAAHAAFAGAPWLEAVVRYGTEPAGKVFIRLLFMLVIPLVVSALALGVAGLHDLGRLGRIGLKTLVYTVSVSVVAVLIGVALVNLLQPGRAVSAGMKDRIGGAVAVPPATPVATPPPVPTTSATAASATGVDFLVNLVPSNVVKSMADNDMLPLMTFALLLGVGLVLTRSEAARRFEEALQGLYDVTMELLHAVIRVAPFGVACLLFTLTARLGLDVIRQLAAYVMVVLLGLAIQQFVVYPLLVYWLGGMSPRYFFAGIKEAMVTAFSTSSSSATLPTALLVAEEKLHVPPEVARFVLTIGSTANQNGTALFEGVTVLFLAQLYGVTLTLGQQLMVTFICILGGIGTAGVPAGSIPVVAMILGLVGVPAEGIGLILGVDRLLDMCRTTLNVTGDLVAAVVVARGETLPPQPASP